MRMLFLFLFISTMSWADDCELGLNPSSSFNDLFDVAERIPPPPAPACIKDVSLAFNNIKKQVTPIALWTNTVFHRKSYRQLLKTRFGLDNHIQGIVRVPGTSTFVLSGGDRYVKEANLFIVNVASSDGKAMLQKNFQKDNARDASLVDGFDQKLDIGTTAYWHAGGLAIVDKILAVPIENPKTKTSKIMFYDMTDSAHPKKLATEIIRPNSTTGTVLFYRKPDGKLVVGGSVNGTMEFFETKTADINEGFQPGSKTIQTTAKGQGTDIIRQCDGKLFIMDFNNTSSFAPIFYGKNYVRLLELDMDTGKTKQIARREFDTNRTCNFKAAGSHHITEDGKLAIYGSSFYRHFGGQQFKMCQFSE